MGLYTDNFLRVEPVSNDAYKILSNYRVIRNLDRTQFQQVQLSNVSDSSWTISPPAQRAVFKRIKDARDGINTSLPINIELIYAFDRAEPAGQPRVDKPLPIINILDKGVAGREQIIEALYEALDPQAPCVEDKAIEFTIQNWLIPTVRLPASIKPKKIDPTENHGLEQNIFIRRRCENNEERGTISFWWEVEQDRWTFDGEIKGAKTEDDKYQGIFFFVWSEKVTGSLTSYSVVTFYI